MNEIAGITRMFCSYLLIFLAIQTNKCKTSKMWKGKNMIDNSNTILLIQKNNYGKQFD